MAAIDNIAHKFIGQGLTFPIVLTAEGRPEIKGGGDLLESSIKNILSWVIGTKFMLGEFGGKLEKLLEEPHDKTLQVLVRYFVIEAITRWDKRLDILEVTVESRSDFSMHIIIKYNIVGTKIVNSFIYPYYSQLIF